MREKSIQPPTGLCGGTYYFTFMRDNRQVKGKGKGKVKGKAAHLSHGALKTSQAFICPSEGLKAPRNSVAFSLNAAFAAGGIFHVVFFLRAFLLALLSFLFAKKGQFLQAALAALGNLQYIELLSYRDHCIFLVPCRRSE